MRKKNYLKWNNSKRVFNTIQWRQDLQISKSIDCVQISAKKISSCLLQNILSKVDKAEKTQVTNHDQEKPRHLFTFLPNQSFPQSQNEGMVSLTYIYFATNSFKMADLIAFLSEQILSYQKWLWIWLFAWLVWYGWFYLNLAHLKQKKFLLTARWE